MFLILIYKTIKHLLLVNQALKVQALITTSSWLFIIHLVSKRL